MRTTQLLSKRTAKTPFFEIKLENYDTKLKNPEYPQNIVDDVWIKENAHTLVDWFTYTKGKQHACEY